MGSVVETGDEIEEESTGDVVEAVIFKKEEVGGSGTADVAETSDVTDATVGNVVDERVGDEDEGATVERVNVEEVEETGNDRKESRSRLRGGCAKVEGG